jgi:hypothetical protein
VSSGSDAHKLKQALKLLESVPSGGAVLRQAKSFWNAVGLNQLDRRFRWGAASRTDAVLTRQFHPSTGEESRTRDVFIVLKRGQSLTDLVLDLAHELTHAVTPPAWDPYDAGLSATGYIRASLEGAGGEVDALLAECRVGQELGLTQGASAQRCRRYLGARTSLGIYELDREKVRKDFYRVGRWFSELNQRIGAETALAAFPDLSAESPQLYSSTGHTPYPLALLREYDEITVIACENTRRRLSLMPGTAGRGRAPASRFLDSRCTESSLRSQQASPQGR